MKLQARLSESQAMIEQLTLKLAQLEKSKAKSATDAAEMAQQLDQVSVEYFAELGMKCLQSIHIAFQAQILNAAMEKKAKQFDRSVLIWTLPFHDPISL